MEDDLRDELAADGREEGAGAGAGDGRYDRGADALDVEAYDGLGLSLVGVAAGDGDGVEVCESAPLLRLRPRLVPRPPLRPNEPKPSVLLKD
mmetsp:Transcript_3578/g.8158  ORF Transcript_3578/g.8158 Transcript_3578/m.8158 type:complete len:92 (+) Transcript_3578:233-508(+)